MLCLVAEERKEKKKKSCMCCNFMYLRERERDHSSEALRLASDTLSRPLCCFFWSDVSKLGK